MLAATNDTRKLNVRIRADRWDSLEALENYLFQLAISNNEDYYAARRRRWCFATAKVFLKLAANVI